MNRWIRLEYPSEKLPFHLEIGDECYFQRDYHPGRSIDWKNEEERKNPELETYIRIYNFKSDLSLYPARLEDKQKAILDFAWDLAGAFYWDKPYRVTFIPASLCRTDPSYDDRMEKTLFALRKLRPLISIEDPVAVRASCRASHLGGERSVGTLMENYQWTGLKNSRPGKLYVIDDIITTGAHFKAHQLFVKKHAACIRTIGLFWARTV